MSSRYLEGRTALVTGSTSGIGLAIASRLAAAGARIAIHGLASQSEADDAERRVRAAGSPEVRFLDADMRDPGAIAGMMRELDGWGPLDVLVNNAGMQKTVSIRDAETQIWDAIIAVNLSAAFHTMHHALPGMGERGFGRVINIASVHGLVASPSTASARAGLQPDSSNPRSRRAPPSTEATAMRVLRASFRRSSPACAIRTLRRLANWLPGSAIVPHTTSPVRPFPSMVVGLPSEVRRRQAGCG